MSDLAEDFSRQSADQQILGNSPTTGPPTGNNVIFPSYENGATIVRENEFMMAERASPGMVGTSARIKANKAQSALVARSVVTPNLDRSFNELQDQATAAEYITALSGIDRGYAIRNLESIIQRMYPGMPPSPAKFVENVKAVANQASLIRDLNSLYTLQSRGDTSRFTADTIAAMQMQLMNSGDLQKIIPTGFGSGAEDVAYSAVGQANMYRDVIPKALWGTVEGAAVAAGAAIVAFLAGVPIALGGGVLGASGIAERGLGASAVDMLGKTGASFKTLMGVSTRIFRNAASFDYYYDQNRGANWHEMTERLKADNVGFNEKGVAQAASIIGAIMAGIQLIELEGFGRIFRGTGTFSSAFYEISTTKGFLGALANGITSRIQGAPGLMGQEVASELAEELAHQFLSEVYLRRVGADPISVSQEEVLSQMGLIIRDTLANTAIFGLGFGVAGGLMDASVYTGKRKIHGLQPMDKTSRDTLANLPLMKDLDIRQVEGTTSLDIGHVPQEEIRLNGQKLYDAAKVNPMLPSYMSPVQRAVLKEYHRLHTGDAAIIDALQQVTGLTPAALDGLPGFEYDTKASSLENMSQLHQRLLSSGENILTDGTPITFALDDGTPAEIRITTDEANITIQVARGEQTGVIHGKADVDGNIKITSVDSAAFENTNDLTATLYKAIPFVYLFGDSTLLTQEDQDLLRTQRSIRNKDVSSLSKSDVETSLETTAMIEESNKPLEVPPEDKTYRREVQVRRDVSETYWEDVEMDDEVPLGDTGVAPEAGPDVDPDLFEAEPRSTGTYRLGVKRAQASLFKFQKTYDDMEQANYDAVSLGETPPHNLEDTYREIEKFEKLIEELQTQEQANLEAYDVLNQSGTPPVEADIAFAEENAERIKSATRVLMRMREKGVDQDIALDVYRATMFEALAFTTERLEQRRIENKIAISLGNAVPYNVSSLLALRSAINETLGIELKETLSDTVSILQEIQGSKMRELDLIQESINEVFDKHNKEPAFKDLIGFARKAAIVDANRAELNVEALRRYRGRRITSGNLVELAQDRLQFYSSIQEMSDTGVARNASMLTPEQRAEGIATPADTVFVEEGVKEERSREETDRGTETKRETRSVKKVRYVKKLVTEDQAFSRSSDPEGTVRRSILNNATVTHRGFTEALLDNINAKIATIRSIAESVRTTKAHDQINALGITNLLDFFGKDESGTIKEGNMEGSTDIERQRVAESMRKSLDKLSLKQLDYIFKEVVGIGRMDIRLGGYRIGDYTMSPAAMANIIARETSVTPMYGKNGEKVRGDFNKGFFRLYDATLAYSAVIEKVRGRESLFYKVFYSDIQNLWLERERYMVQFNTEFGAKFNDLPGVLKPNEYYTEVVHKFGEFELDKDNLITLLQHRRDADNWKFIVANGLSVPGADSEFVLLGPEVSKDIVDFVEEYELSPADEAAVDIFQAGMDRLFGLANAYSLQVNGVPLTQQDFYIRRRPEFLTLEGKQQFLSKTDTKMSLFTDTAEIKERIDTKKPIKLVGAGYEFEQTTKNITSQFFLARAFTRAETLMNNENVRNSMNNKFHKEFWGIVRDGLERWRGRAFQDDLGSRIFDGARQNFVAASLGLNLEVAVMQTFSLPLYLTMVDAKYLTQASYEANLHPDRTDEALSMWSRQYLLRNSAGMIDIKEGRETSAKKAKRANKNIGLMKFHAGLKKMKEFTFGPIRSVDKFTVRMGSLAAFTQVMTEIENNHFTDSVRAALDVDDSMIAGMTVEVKMQLAGMFVDYVMERTQPMAQEQHMSKFQRQNAGTRTLTSFSGFTNQMNTLYYRMAVDFSRGVPGSGKAFARTLFMGTMLLPTMVGLYNVGRSRLHGILKGEDSDDQDPFLKQFLLNYINAVSGSWFIMRDAVRYVNNYVLRGTNANNIVDIPLFEIVELYLNVFTQTFEAANWHNTDEVRENNARHAWRNLRRAVAYTFGFPFTPMRIYSELQERKEN